MPLGASITYGEPSDPASLGRGYRKYIRDWLRSRGWNVNMVGSRTHGQFADNDVEGWPSFIIDSITEKARDAVPKYKPNLILINAGTNDATGNIDIENAGERMRTLVQTCFDLSPGVVVVLSTLLPNTHAPDNVLEINRLYRDLVIELQAAGKKIELADMDDGFITLDHILPCGTHPTIEGQRRMAAVWGLVIQEIEERGGWFQAPSSNVSFSDSGNGTTCAKEYNSGAQDPRNGMQVLRGNSPLIVDDGDYVHRSASRGMIWSASGYYPFPGSDQGLGVYAAQAVNLGGADRGGELDDIILVKANNTDVVAYLNQGDGTFKDSNAKVDGHCIVRGIRWGDVNNDGLDDFICIDPSGNMFVSINEGTNPPSWRDVGKFKDAVSGYGQDRVRLGDIDGDGRLDYCVINDNGSLHCWRNGGILFDSAKYWQDMGIVFKTSETLPDIAMMRFVDINGDFRSDILWVDKTGKVRTWINQRGHEKSLVPYWRDAGVTHEGMHEDVKGQENIIFGRVYSRRPSYLYRHTFYSPYGAYFLTATVWENLGSGGTTQKGDGAHWGDMTGTGNDDYVWIEANGKVVIFPNVNTPPDTTGYPNWGVAQTLDTGLDRKALHVGDWNSDGKADIIGVDKHTGSLIVWLTTYSNGVFSFRKVTSGNSYCTEGWGVGLFDLGHHFADITGSGCVDYLCMQPDGKTTAWLNDCKTDLFALRNVGQVKFSENLDRANHRFADVDGDGLADFLWVDKFTGDASVWINKGEQPEDERDTLGGSKFRWDKSGPLYAGSNRGANLHYPNLGGQGRADQVDVDPNTAKGYVSFNTCPPGGDDGGIVPRDPLLPGYEPRPQCSVNICRLDGTGFDGYAGADPCGPDPFADGGDDDDDDSPDTDDRESTVATQNSTLNFNSTASYWKSATSFDSTSTDSTGIILAPNNKNRPFDITWLYLGIRYSMRIRARRYPGSTHLHDPVRGPAAPNIAVRMERNNGCRSTNIEVIDSRTLTRQQLLNGYDTEHNPDLQMLQDFSYTMATSILPGGGSSRYSAIPGPDMVNYWNQPVLPQGLPRTGTSRYIDQPVQYMFDQIGSYGNRAGLILCQKDFNGVKGRVFNLNTQDGVNEGQAPYELGRFRQMVDQSLTSTAAQNEMIEALRQVIGVFRYINNNQVRPILGGNIRNMVAAADEIAATVPHLANIGVMFREFYPVWYQEAARTARAWVADRINDIIARYTQAMVNGMAPPNAAIVQMLVNQLFDDLSYIVSPY
ncbi:hypothetical protein F5Y07DRAFT_402064 [Xylaria sp. FL0933]|nr:hypothetical protein F5Y07DRAFT_402064 [Xylaria sp. FL0933]